MLIMIDLSFITPKRWTFFHHESLYHNKYSVFYYKDSRWICHKKIHISLANASSWAIINTLTIRLEAHCAYFWVSTKKHNALVYWASIYDFMRTRKPGKIQSYSFELRKWRNIQAHVFFSGPRQVVHFACIFSHFYSSIFYGIIRGRLLRLNPCGWY